MIDLYPSYEELERRLECVVNLLFAIYKATGYDNDTAISKMAEGIREVEKTVPHLAPPKRKPARVQ